MITRGRIAKHERSVRVAESDSSFLLDVRTAVTFTISFVTYEEDNMSKLPEKQVE